jgi:acyl carrier protein
MNAKENEKKIAEIFSSLFEVNPSELKDSSSSADIAKWDSLQHLNLVLALEEAFGLQLSPDEVESMRSLGEIKRMLRGKGVEI